MAKARVMDTCWLCGKIRPLTEEHIPPRAAFNEFPVLLQQVDRLTTQVGHLIWDGEVKNGLTAFSLCEECNNNTGRKYGGDYVRFVKSVAERVESTSDGGKITVEVRRPLSVLKQVIHNFVTANGPYFVEKYPWIRKFMRDSRDRALPDDLYVYIFATNTPGGRKSGVAGFYDLTKSRAFVVAEFSFWPLGTVIAFQPMDGFPLTPIHHWRQHEFKFDGTVSVELYVNSTVSASPVDFRTREEIVRDRLFGKGQKFKGSQLKELQEAVYAHDSAKNRDTFVFSGRNPELIDPNE